MKDQEDEASGIKIAELSISYSKTLSEIQPNTSELSPVLQLAKSQCQIPKCSYLWNPTWPWSEKLIK